ncbi:MAG: sigma-70 family RNA polymerase sigma factor [Planctomycetota bacterium]
MRDLRHTSIEALLAERDFIRNLARSLVRENDVADEIAQQSWVAAWRAGEQPLGALRPWLTAITRNLAFRFHRDASRRRRREEVAARNEEVRATDEVAMRIELERDLAEAVLRLPGLERDLVGLRFYEGLSLREAARRLEMPYTTARRTLESSLERLRQELSDGRGDCKHWSAGLAFLAAESSKAGRHLVWNISKGALWMGGTFVGVLAVIVASSSLISSGGGDESEESIGSLLVAEPPLRESEPAPLGEPGDGRLEGTPGEQLNEEEQPASVATKAEPGIRARLVLQETEQHLFWQAFCIRVPEAGPIRDEHELVVRASRERTIDLEKDARDFEWLDLEPGDYQIGLLRERRLAKVEAITVAETLVERDWTIAPVPQEQLFEIELPGAERCLGESARWEVSYNAPEGPTGFAKRTPIRRADEVVQLVIPLECEAILSAELPGQVWVSAMCSERRRVAEILPGNRRAELRFDAESELSVELIDVPDDADSVTVVVVGGGENLELTLGGYYPAENGRAKVSLPPGRYDVWAECVRQGGRLESESETVQIRLAEGGGQVRVRFVPAHDLVLQLPEGHPRSILDVQNLETGAARRYTVSEGHKSWMLQRLPAGRYRITLDGLEPAEVDVPVRGERLRLQ